MSENDDLKKSETKRAQIDLAKQRQGSETLMKMKIFRGLEPKVEVKQEKQEDKK